jgi:hypothetical protein
LLLAVAGGVLAAFGMDSNTMNPADWRQLGIGGGIASCFGMLVAYLFGGYVAGRMARRRGAAHGFGVFVVNTLAAAVLVGVAGWQMGSGPVLDAMRRNGIPTGWSAWNDVAPWVAGGALIAMLVGAVAGGRAGERWHRRVADVVECEIDLREAPAARGEHYADDEAAPVSTADEDTDTRVLH